MDFDSYLNLSVISKSSDISTGADLILFNASLVVLGLIDAVIVGLMTKCLLFGRGYHPNLKMILANFLFGLFLISATSFLMGLAVFLNFIQLKNRDWILALGLAVVHGPNLCRITLFCLILERAVATVKTSSYEKTRNARFGAILSICAQGLAAFLGVNYYFLGFNMYFQLAILFVVDFLNILALIALKKINKTKRQIHSRSKIELSQRYQIAENIRVLNVLFPLILAGIVINIAGLTSTTLQSYFSPLQMLRTGYYYILNLLFPIISFIIVWKRDPSAKKRIQSIWSQVDVHASLTSFSTTENQRISVKNVVGAELITENSPDRHFQNLNSLWK